MASLTIRNLDETVKAKLRLRAARHGRSMEEEARRILGGAVDDARTEPAERLTARIRKLVAPVGGIDAPPPEDEYMDFDAVPNPPARTAKTS